MLSEAMERFIKEHEKEAYDLLLTIAKIPSPSNHEEKRAQFCCNWLKEQGAEGVYIDEALNVVYPAVLRDNVDVYMAHTDVVFPDETELPLKAVSYTHLDVYKRQVQVLFYQQAHLFFCRRRIS